MHKVSGAILSTVRMCRSEIQKTVAGLFITGLAKQLNYDSI